MGRRTYQCNRDFPHIFYRRGTGLLDEIFNIKYRQLGWRVLGTIPYHNTRSVTKLRLVLLGVPL